MQPRAIDPFNADVEVVGQALIQAAVEGHSPQRLQPLPEAIAQARKPLGALGGIGKRTLQGFGQPNGQRQRDTAAAQPPLLAAAMELGVPRSALKVQLRDAARFWPAEGYHQNYAERNPLRYRFYRTACGRDRRLDAVWGARARTGKPWS